MARTEAAAVAGHRVTPPRTARNVVFTWVAFAFNVGVNFFLSPFVVHTLGNTQYGVWVLLASLVGYMGLLDLGVRSAVMRYIARHHARMEDEEAGRVASAGLAIFSGAGLIALTASAVVAVLLDHLFKIPADTLLVARVVVLVGGLNIAISLISGVFGGAVAAMQRFDLSAGVGIAVNALRAAGIVASLSAGGGLLALSLVQLGCTLLSCGASVVIISRLYPQLRYRFRGLDRSRIKQIFSFSIYSSLLHVSRALIFSADSVVIGTFLPIASITFFAIGSTLTDYTRGIVSAISQTMTPRASALDGVNATKELERVLLKAGALASLVALPITITFILRGHSFIGLWMGAGYADTSGRVLVILSIALAFAAAGQVVMSTMIGVNRHRELAPFYLAEGLLNIGMSVYWVRSIGILGVALGTAVPNLVTTLLVVPWLVRRVLGTSLRSVWTAFWLRPLAAMIPFAAATWAVQRLWPARGLVDFFAGVSITLPVAAAGAWFIALPPAERHALASSVSRLRLSAFGRT